MRKITSILLALTFVLYLGGMQVLYWVKISVHKQETATMIQHNNVAKDKTAKFSFTSTEYNSIAWSERNKEFSFQGQRYDIIGIQYCSDEVIVTCYADKDETSLADAFSGFIKKMFAAPQHNSDSGNGMANSLCKEYMPSDPLLAFFYEQQLTSIKARCMLVNIAPYHANIWHPPTLA
jgi:hypothetical protein